MRESIKRIVTGSRVFIRGLVVTLLFSTGVIAYASFSQTATEAGTTPTVQPSGAGETGSGFLAANQESGDVEYERMLRDEVIWLRGQFFTLYNDLLKQCGIDTVEFYFSKLTDTNFIWHYGDYDQPANWQIAAERLGRVGRPVIPRLMRLLDSTQGRPQSTVLYALLLASQSDNLKHITKGEYPHWDTEPYKGHDEVTQWKIWYDKYKAAIEAQSGK